MFFVTKLAKPPTRDFLSRDFFRILNRLPALELGLKLRPPTIYVFSIRLLKLTSSLRHLVHVKLLLKNWWGGARATNVGRSVHGPQNVGSFQSLTRFSPF